MSFVDLGSWPLSLIVAAFAVAAVAIGVGGTAMTRLADRLADLTGLGEALFGAVLLGGSTSLPGIMTSVVTAAEGHPELAISNAIGGIAAQTTFLAVADITYLKANLEHAAASVENLVQGALLSTLLALPLLAAAGPRVDVAGVHPVSIILIVAYIAGLRLVSKARRAPLWQPRRTRETETDTPDEELGSLSGGEMTRVWLGFAGLAAIVAAAGFVVAHTGIAIAGRTGISETVVGGLFTAVATSLPELVTSIAAVRRGALTLAVGGIIGGNCFDVLFLAFADGAYRGGSLYHAMTDRQTFMIALTLLLTGILTLGLLRRERSGIGNIGFESALVLLVYLAGVAVLVWQG